MFLHSFLSGVDGCFYLDFYLFLSLLCGMQVYFAAIPAICRLCFKYCFYYFLGTLLLGDKFLEPLFTQHLNFSLMFCETLFCKLCLPKFFESIAFSSCFLYSVVNCGSGGFVDMPFVFLLCCSDRQEGNINCPQIILQREFCCMNLCSSKFENEDSIFWRS